MLKPGEIEATARAYNTQSEIIPGLAHNSMLEPGWQAVAERILVWLKGRTEVVDISTQAAEPAGVPLLRKQIPVA
jgi:hypothetical protein